MSSPVATPRSHAAPARPFDLTARVVRQLQRSYRTAAAVGGALPAFRLELDDGATYDFGAGDIAFAVRVRDRAGRAALASLDETRIREAFMVGSMDLDGAMLEILRLRPLLNDRHPLRSLWNKLLHPIVFGQVASDKKWIAQHYDEDADFYELFLDARTPFEVVAVHNDRHNDELTCRHWAERLESHRDEIARRWGKGLFRRFQLYLWGCVEVFSRDVFGAYRVVLELGPRARA